MKEGVLLLDRSGISGLANPALRAMIRLGVEIRGKPLLDAIRNAELKRLLDQALAGERIESAMMRTFVTGPRS